MRNPFPLLLFLLCLTSLLSAQESGVRGYIRNAAGEPLINATVYARQSGTGAVTNVDGYYELRLAPGAAGLVFQYLGYESRTETRRIEAGQWTELSITLPEQTLDLALVEVGSDKEDPAYTIMRKAIAKAEYHRLQIDRYSAKVYVKGSGRLLRSPGIIRGRIEKEGIDSTMAFTSESVSMIEYERPNIFRERVISIYQTGSNNDMSAQGFIFGSFYQPEIAEAVSPLSPRAFGYYRFSYEGFFRDRGYGVNKIRVTPRSRGDNVFEGYIYILDDLWAIHSLDLTTLKFGIGFDISQLYAPVREKVWLPISGTIDVTGRILGFGFEYKYLTTISDYTVVLNNDLPATLTIIDETIAPAPPAENDLQERVASGEELTRRELRQLMREYEKEEKADRRRDTVPEVTSDYTFTIDSTAGNRDSAYWAQMRPVPLTAEEEKGYAWEDSLAQVQAEKMAGDTAAVKRKGSNQRFGAADLFFGDSYKLGENRWLDLRGPVTLNSPRFNVVEGYSLSAGLGLRATGNRPRWQLGTDVRYGFAWKRLTWTAAADLEFGSEAHPQLLQISGGRTLQQYHPGAINPLLNSLTSLLSERNFIRLFEKEFLQTQWEKKWRSTASLQLSAQWADRRTVRAHSDAVIFDRKDRTYAGNVPQNRELNYPLPERERAFVLTGGFEIRPWQTYRRRNGQLQPDGDRSPTFRLDYRKGLSGIGGSITDYDLLEFTYRHRFDIGVRGKVDLKLNAGTFLNNDYTGFADFKHFDGNQLSVTTADPVGSYRLLPYYEYSTREQYLSGFAHYQFRKFLLTRIWEVHLLGIRENIFANYLTTPTSGDYLELGYSLDNILSILRLEVVASFQGGRYEDFGILLGVSTNIGRNIQIDAE